jgi:hypothetical protein
VCDVSSTDAREYVLAALIDRPSFGEILKENTLDVVIIQSAIKDTIGQAFWIQHFVEYVRLVGLRRQACVLALGQLERRLT